MFEILALEFFQRSLLVGSLLAVVLAFLGVFVVLRRLSFFSDAIGHSALTGIAIGLILSINPFLSAVAFALLVAVLIVIVRSKSRLAIDTLLGIFFPTAVSFGVILVYLTPGYQTDLISFLFGDIITVSTSDIVMSSVLLATVVVLLFFAGKALISITLNSDLAKAEGIPVTRYELMFLLVLAGAIALSIKLVGIVLVTAMLVIPAATAQNMARSLATLFSISVLVALITVISGMITSAVAHLPSGPVIIIIGAGLFTLSLFLRPFLKHI